MNSDKTITGTSKKKRVKNIALVLASGGSRGFAHIGAIDELLSRGYKITSISGTSMGALVGGVYAAGGLDAFKEWMRKFDKFKMFTLMDFTISTDGLVKGQKLIKELKTVVPDNNIEELSIPFTAVATDIWGRKEVVFRSGSLFDAIRSSISIPSVFKPYKIGTMRLIDGGIVNPIPLNRVERHKGDLLFAIDLNAACNPHPQKQRKTVAQKLEEKNFFEMLHLPTLHFDPSGLFKSHSNEDLSQYGESKESLNYYQLLTESFGMMIQTNSERSLILDPPDLLITIPRNSYNTMEFYKYEEIVDLGRRKCAEVLDRYEAGL